MTAAVDPAMKKGLVEPCMESALRKLSWELSSIEQVTSPGSAPTEAPSTFATPATLTPASPPLAPHEQAVRLPSVYEESELTLPKEPKQDHAPVVPEAKKKPADGAVLRLRGLPFKCTEHDVLNFVGQPHRRHVTEVKFIRNKDGRPSGMALVSFSDWGIATEVRRLRDRQLLGPTRFVEIFGPSTIAGGLPSTQNSPALHAQAEVPQNGAHLQNPGVHQAQMGTDDWAAKARAAGWGEDQMDQAHAVYLDICGLLQEVTGVVSHQPGDELELMKLYDALSPVGKQVVGRLCGVSNAAGLMTIIAQQATGYLELSSDARGTIVRLSSWVQQEAGGTQGALRPHEDRVVPMARRPSKA